MKTADFAKVADEKDKTLIVVAIRVVRELRGFSCLGSGYAGLYFIECRHSRVSEWVPRPPVE